MVGYCRHTGRCVARGYVPATFCTGGYSPATTVYEGVKVYSLTDSADYRRYYCVAHLCTSVASVSAIILPLIARIIADIRVQYIYGICEICFLIAYSAYICVICGNSIPATDFQKSNAHFYNAPSVFTSSSASLCSFHSRIKLFRPAPMRMVRNFCWINSSMARKVKMA